jgi:hypothetical protein
MTSDPKPVFRLVIGRVKSRDSELSPDAWEVIFGMRFLVVLLFGLAVENGFSQMVVGPRRAAILAADGSVTNAYVYPAWGYGGYYAEGGYYGYGGYAGRGRDWNNYSDGRYQSRGNHRAADRAAGEPHRSGGRR